MTSSTNFSLSADTETKMRLEFRRKVLTGTDAYKRAVFCVVANCDSALDHPEVADKIEDWLWLRLTLARHGELKRRSDPTDKGALAALQNQISVEYGTVCSIMVHG
jgi:nuclear pore complex protein Nup93